MKTPAEIVKSKIHINYGFDESRIGVLSKTGASVSRMLETRPPGISRDLWFMYARIRLIQLKRKPE